MPTATEGLFLPGWGASGNLYASGMPDGWMPVDPPGFRRSGGSFEHYRSWIVEELDRRDRPVALGGHSMGAALAIVAAAERPQRVTSLVLVSPAGLPLTKPILKSLGWFLAYACRGWYPAAETTRAVARTVGAPWSALRLAHEVHDADLSPEMELVRAASIPAKVIGCTGDSLVTTAHCRRAARLLGAEYRELELDGGHMWMLRAWPRLADELA